MGLEIKSYNFRPKSQYKNVQQRKQFSWVFMWENKSKSEESKQELRSGTPDSRDMLVEQK